MKTLRILITNECNKSCKKCCNKQQDLKALSVVKEEELKDYDEIIITGGEPTYKIEDMFLTLRLLNNSEIKAKKYLYTNGYNPIAITSLLDNYFDGITLSLHSKKDLINFRLIHRLIEENNLTTKSLRLNVFKGIPLPKDLNLSFWKIKDNIVWLDNCPLPSNETFKKLTHETII